jgi:alkaline phosphatase D
MKSRKYFLLLFSIIFSQFSFSQQSLISSGPMPGYSEMKEVAIWLQTKSQADVLIKYRIQGTQKEFLTNKVKTQKETAFTALLIADTLEPGNIYHYDVYVNGIKETLPFETTFKTQKLWKWRSDAPNFSFLMGSGAYINEKKYDRPGDGYGGNYEIYNAMAKENPDFMLWLGDNVYLREPDWNSWTGIVHRYTQARETSELRSFISSTHNYAILDDHDFGPNDSDRSFWNKNQTMKAFELFWANPSYGVGNINGAITSFEYADCEFFLLDNRYYRTPNKRKTGEKTQLGEEQLQWLFDNIASSNAKFKFVVMGGQFLSTSGVYEAYSSNGFGQERQKIIDFIYDEEIKNVVFLTGDVHFSEIAVLRENEKPTIWDITASPLNSGFNSHANEQNNTLRIPESVIMERNYTQIKVIGNKEERHLEINYFNTDGELIYNLEIKPEEVKRR